MFTINTCGRKKERLHLEDMKQIEVRLLDVLDEYCSIHRLRYYLTYGTLIGALRHKGFIPWDDDIDVIMPRSDYEKLLSGFSLNSDYPGVRLLSHRDEKKYCIPFTKLVDTNTVLIENTSIEFEMGVYIDIFPLDNLSDDFISAKKKMAKAFRFNEQLIFKSVKWRKGRSAIKNIALMGGKAALAYKPVGKIVEELDDFCCELSSDSLTDYVGVMAGISRGDDSRIFKREWFESAKIVEFEGKRYPAPIGAHEFLQKLYGDYMQLPPVEQRVTHHSYEVWMKE